MGEIAAYLASKNAQAKIEKAAQSIASAPELSDLTADQLRHVVQWVTFNRYAAQMNKAVDVLDADYAASKAAFLAALNSEHTIKGYAAAFKTFEEFAIGQGLNNPLESTAKTADDWIYFMRAKELSAATIRRNAAAMSSFFTFVDRRTGGTVRNPFAGTRALPKLSSVKRIENEIPVENLALFARDIQTIIDNEQDATLKAIIVCMARRGLRAGAFEKMSIHGGKFFTVSKGKRIDGKLPDECLDAIKDAGLKFNEPFKSYTSAKVSSSFEYHISKLYKAGKISYRYSCHDLRHFYALKEYTATKDIYRVSKLLHHASVSVTQVYLRGLNVPL